MALNSMTGYGRGEQTESGQTYACEIRTLNSRFLEVSVRLPRHLIALEPELIAAVKSSLGRGKVDVFFDLSSMKGTDNLPTLNKDNLKHYITMLLQVRSVWQQKAGTNADAMEPSLTEVLNLPQVLESSESPQAKDSEAALQRHRAQMLAALDAALNQIKQARGTEGRSLEQALIALTDELDSDRQRIEARVDELRAQQTATYKQKLSDLLTVTGSNTLPPEERMVSEIAVLLEKSDIAEELTRLSTHIAEFRRLMDKELAAGRKLDFMCQELHREVNTISNKAVNTSVAHVSLNMKQTIERLRQQVQNIE